MTCQLVPVNLSTAVTICETIEGLLGDSLGPNALHTMLTSSSGNVVITGDGHTLLTSLHLSHPTARWLADRVKGHHGITGDSSKSFILIVTEMLRQLQKAISPRNASSAEDLIAVGRALETIQSEVFPQMVLPALLKHCMHLDLVEAKREDVVGVCKKIVRTALGGKFNRHSTEHVAGLTVDLVCSSCHDISSLEETTQGLIREYDVTCLEVPNWPVSKSKLLDGVVLSRNFAVQLEGLDSLPTVPFVILRCLLDKWVPDSLSSLVTESSNDMMKVFQFGASRTQSLISHLKKRGVKLLLSSELLSDATLSFCRASEISAVHMVPDEELNRLARLTKTDIVYDSCDILSPALKIGSASFCQSVSLGQHAGIHLGFSRKVCAKQLILCAPTQGICRQWFMAVFNTLKMLSMWLDTTWLSAISTSEEHNTKTTSSEKWSSEQITLGCDSDESPEHPNVKHCDLAMQANAVANKPNILHSGISQSEASKQNSTVGRQKALCIAGGGCTEFIVHGLFQSLASGNARDCSFNTRDPSLIVAARILCETALCIPRTLHRNSFSPKGRKSSFLEVVSKAKDSSAPVGVNGRTGALCDQAEYGALEPLSARFMLWREAIGTVQDLLRIDMIVGVKSLPHDHRTDSRGED